MGRLVLRQGAWAKHSLLLVHSQDLSVPAHRLSTRIGLPYVVVAHGLEPDSPRYARAPRIRAYEAALTAAERVVAVGPGLAGHLLQEAPRADVRVVVNGFDRPLVERILAEPLSSRVDVRIASVSNLNEGKGIHITLEALAARRERGCAVPRYDVVGDGPARGSLQTLASRLGLEDRVRFHGALPRDAALRLVRGAVGFVLPSAPEACGVAYLEAMAMGVAPCAIRGEGPAAFVGDGVSGLLVERTVPAVAAAIDRLMDEAGIAARLGVAARRCAEGLDWGASARRLVDVLPAPGATRSRVRVPTWLSLYNEPTPYVVGKQDEIEATGEVRLRRVWASVNSSQAWGLDAPYRAEDVLDRPSRTIGVALDLLRGRFAGLHAGGWGGPRATPILLLAAWLGRRPLVIESDTHQSHARGLRGAARRTLLRFLDLRVRAWLPGGTPQAEHLARTFHPKAPVRIEGMTTDTTTLLGEAARLGPAAAPRFRGEMGVSRDGHLVLYVGRIAPEKGVPDLVEAVAGLLSEGHDVHLALLGPGVLAPAVAARLPSERIRAPGRVPWRALVPAYLAADVLALPSLAEPWGLVVNEALLFGCPAVVTDAVGCARDLVGATGAGQVVPVGSVPAMADALRSILTAGGRRSSFGARALEAGRSWSRVRAARVVRAAMLGRAASTTGSSRC